jgi:hypothetical protein
MTGAVLEGCCLIAAGLAHIGDRCERDTDALTGPFAARRRAVFLPHPLAAPGRSAPI